MTKTERGGLKDPPLSGEEVRRVVEGRGAARRVPLAIHQWIGAGTFGPRAAEYQAVLDAYPNDLEVIGINMPGNFDAPPGDPTFRWLNFDEPPRESAHGLDAGSVMGDWSRLDGVLAEFPRASYPGLIGRRPPDRGLYRIGLWWGWLFERFWSSFRVMEDALCDFHEHGEEVHRLFAALTAFYKEAVTRARNELGVDAIWTSDDIGMQTGPFFSLGIFREFFKPYYRELIEHTHRLGMHFWLHACGNIKVFIPEFIEIGLDVLHPIQKYTMDEREIAREFGRDLCIWAGMDVQRTIPYGSPADVRREVRFMFDTYFRPEGRFMLTAGNAMTADTPLESLKALLDEALRYGTAIAARRGAAGGAGEVTR